MRPATLINRKSGNRFVLSSEEMTIGRSSVCDIQIVDRSMSRRHAAVRWMDDKWIIEDLGARNHLYINGTKVDQATLRPGHIIQMGNIELVFESKHHINDHPTTIHSLPNETIRAEPSRLPQVAPDRLAVFYKIAGRLCTTLEKQQLLQEIQDNILDTLAVNRVTIALREAETDRFFARARDGRSDQATTDFSRSILNHVLQNGEAILIPSTLTDNNWSDTESIAARGITSSMCAPLTDTVGSIVGAIYVDSRDLAHGFQLEDLDFLRAAAHMASIALQNAFLLQERVQRELMEDRLNTARQMQQQMLPQELPGSPRITFTACNRPGDYVSGDYYDVLKMNENRYLAIIGDVSGKGVSAALMASSIQAAIRSLWPMVDDVADLVTRLDRALHNLNVESSFSTLAALDCDVENEKIMVCNAGHNPAILVSNGSLTYAALATNLPIGVLGEQVYTANELPMSDLRHLVLYTDGTTEARNVSNELLGEQRWLEIVRSHQSDNEIINASRLCDDVQAYAGSAKQADDITAMTISFHR